MIRHTATPRRSADLVLAQTDEGSLLVTPAGRPLVRLNDPAAALWQVCDGSTSVDEISDAVAALVGTDDVVEHVHTALDELVTLGALEMVDEPSSLSPTNSTNPRATGDSGAAQ